MNAEALSLLSLHPEELSRRMKGEWSQEDHRLATTSLVNYLMTCEKEKKEDMEEEEEDCLSRASVLLALLARPVPDETEVREREWNFDNLSVTIREIPYAQLDVGSHVEGAKVWSSAAVLALLTGKRGGGRGGEGE